MTTALGKFLRKIRIDSDEILYNMAMKLDVSTAFLSAVECGKKKMPKKWRKLIIENYKLSNDEILTFDKAIAETENCISIDLSNIGNDNKEFAISFARSFDALSKDQIKRITEIMQEEDK